MILTILIIFKEKKTFRSNILIKLDTNPNNNTKEIKIKKLLKYEGSYPNSRPETESNILKNSLESNLIKDKIGL